MLNLIVCRVSKINVLDVLFLNKSFIVTMCL